MKNAPFHDLFMDQHWKVLLDALDVGILMVGHHWDLIYANPHVGTLCGCQTPEALATLWDTRLKEVAMAAFAVGAGIPAPGSAAEFQIAGEEKSRRLRMEYFPLQDESGLGAVLIRDCSGEDNTQGDLRIMGRYRSLARLYRTMGHDLKAPLNALTINLDLLKTSMTKYAPPDPLIRERQQRYLKVLEDEMGRLNRSLVTFLSQAVPPTQESTRPFDLRELLMELISLIAPQARQQQVAVEVSLDEQDMILEGQRDLLKQALLNMAVNALEAMTGGGRLTIKLETRMGRAVIQLRDTGAGIAPEVVEKIWELHYTTKKTGTGIGLYVARSVIESFGGILSVESQSGQGTCFTVSLPISPKEAI